MPRMTRARGFTLLELLVGAAVGAVVLLGISLTFISQARQYQAHASRRAVQANSRQALSFMERKLRTAGYGVDPDRAIIPYDSYDVAADQSTPGYPDAFVVHWRDPIFRRRANPVSSASITLDAPLTEPLRRGQILLLICSPNPQPTDPSVNDNPPHAFVTVGQPVAVGMSNIPLDQSAPVNSPVALPGRFFHEQALLNSTNCLKDATFQPYVVLVHRAAFYVATFDHNGSRTPYLMMHQGLDMPAPGNPTGDGTIDATDAVPVAEGIEQLQVAYILNTHDDPNIDPDRTPEILGVNAPMGDTHYGEDWEANHPPNLPTGWFFNPGNPNPLFTDPQLLAKARIADHPANIRQVRVSLVTRSTIPDPGIRGDDLLLKPNNTPYPDGEALANGTVPWRHLENLTNPVTDYRPAGRNFYRVILRQSVTPKNLLMNRQFIPVTQGGG